MDSDLSLKAHFQGTTTIPPLVLPTIFISSHTDNQIG